MTIKEKINAIQLEIKNYKWQPNGIPFFPLPDKLKYLIKLFNVDSSANPDLIEYAKDEPIQGLTWCLDECNCGYCKEDWWIDKTIDQVKERSSIAIRNFFVACHYFKVNILNEECVP
jgi:hypothetical protein